MIDKEQLQKYLETQEQIQKRSDELFEKQKLFEEENKEIIDKISEYRNTLSDIKEELKIQGLAEFDETNDKKLTGGLWIRITTSLEYEEQLLIKWCKEKMPVAVLEKLDKKVFESFAKTNEVPGVIKKETKMVTFPKEVNIEGEKT